MNSFPVQVFKRYQMVLALDQWTSPQFEIPEGFDVLPWSDNLLLSHGDAIYESFCDSIDAGYFITFTHRERCRNFMRSLVFSSSFAPEATWLIRKTEMLPATTFHRARLVGRPAATIQGLIHSDFTGGIQNVGVLPEFRHKGLSKILLYYCLWGYKRLGIKTVSLEVTAENEIAINLYKSMGFTQKQTVFKPRTAH